MVYCTNSPVGHNNCIAEQERSFKDKAEAENIYKAE